MKIVNKNNNKFKNIKLFKKNDKKEKKEKQKKETYSFKEVIIIMIFCLCLGFMSCLSFERIYSNSKLHIGVLKDLAKVIDSYYEIIDNYYGEIDKDALIEGAVSGMLSSVDDNYTGYSNKETTDEFLETVSGTYEGIGCTISVNENNEIYVVEVFDNSPSSKAGLQTNDIILKVDDKITSELTTTELANYIKKEAESEIKMIIKREEKELEISLVRDSVETPTVTKEIFEKDSKKVGYINISLFTSVTAKQFKEKLKELEKENITGLVIDVRDNSGGYLSTVTDIIDLFLKKGEIIYQLEDDNGITKIKDTTKESRSYPVAVLINGSSASASEILASAIKESYSNGFVVGTNSYGKGTVQRTVNLSDGSMLKYTIQKWLTPDGNWINETGVEPTDLVLLSENYFLTYNKEDDNQLQEAINIVTK